LDELTYELTDGTESFSVGDWIYAENGVIHFDGSHSRAKADIFYLEVISPDNAINFVLEFTTELVSTAFNTMLARRILPTSFLDSNAVVDPIIVN
jgi:hypothetical protein